MMAEVTLHKAEKYAFNMRRLSEDDRRFFMQNFGCARKVYNLCVDFLYRKLEELGYTGGDVLPQIRFPEVSSFKKDRPYLKDADSLGLANAKLSFQAAVKRYNTKYDHVSHTKSALRRSGSGTEPLSFRGLKGMPKFRSKARGDFSYTTNCQHAGPGKSRKRDTVRLIGDMLYLPKLKHGVQLIVHRPLPKDAVIGNVTVSMDADGKFSASIEYTYTARMDLTLRTAAMNGDTSVLEELNIIGLDYSQ